MKDKEKQIEEMADFLFDHAEDYCAPEGHIITNKLAEALYNAGYRKLNIKEFKEDIEELKEEVCKETAEEIFRLCLSDEYIAYFDEGIIKELAEKYGVEVEKCKIIN